MLLKNILFIKPEEYPTITLVILKDLTDVTTAQIKSNSVVHIIDSWQSNFKEQYEA